MIVGAARNFPHTRPQYPPSDRWSWKRWLAILKGMRFLTDDFTYADPGPEEIALDGWLEESGPYMSLSDADSASADELDED